jgi:hypothetical protein
MGFGKRFAEEFRVLLNISLGQSYPIPAPMKDFLQRELSESRDISAEYSGMIKAYVESLPANWDGS